MVLPPPRPARLLVQSGPASALLLPAIPMSAPDSAAVPSQSSTAAAAANSGLVTERLTRSGVICIELITPAVTWTAPGADTMISQDGRASAQIQQTDLFRSHMAVKCSTSLSRETWRTRTEASVVAKIEPESVEITEATRAYEDDRRIVERTFVTSVLRR
jgi:hypothetical protein